MMAAVYTRRIWSLFAVMALCAATAPAQTAANASGAAGAMPTAPVPHVIANPASSEQRLPGHERALSGPVVTVQELVAIALERNPAIQGAVARTQAQRARVPQARALPDPMFSGGWMGSMVPFGVKHNFAPSFRGLSVQQKFPYPGKRKLRGEIADRQAEAASWMAEGVRRKVTSEVKVAYYKYFYYTKALEITRKNKDLLEKLERIAEARYRVGKGIQQDVLRAQVEVARIDQKLIVLNQQLATAKVRLNTLLYRDPESPLPAPAAPMAAHFDLSLQALYSLAAANDTVLQQDRRVIEGSRDAVKLAQKSYEPDFAVTYMYQQRPDLQDTNGFTVGINIPIFYRHKQRERVIEASHDLIGAQRSLDERRTTVNYEINQQYLAAQAAKKLMNLYSKAIVPQSSLALESSMSAYEVGKVDFLSMLDNFTYVLDYEVDYYRELSQYESALAKLEPLVGKELTK
jgi:outer membrane protein, heavy metal efflux system